MVLGCLASWAVNVLFQWDALPFYLVHILVWFLSDWIMLSVVQVSNKHSDSHNCVSYRIVFLEWAAAVQ